jgi:hypothetical protein
MLGKIFRLSLLFLLLILILAGAFVQTDFFQSRLARWIEHQTKGKLSIGELRGVIPFWIHLKDIRYRTEEAEASFEVADVTLMPISLFFGKLAIADLQIKNAKVLFNAQSSISCKLAQFLGFQKPSLQTKAEEKLKAQSDRIEWPIFPLHMEIYSLHIESFSTQFLENLDVEGTASFQKDFFLNLHLTHPNWENASLHLMVDSDSNTQTLEVTGNFKDERKRIAIWMEGNYDWQTARFTGALRGQGEDWRGFGNFDLEEHKQLSLAPFHLFMDGYAIDSEIKYNLGTQFLSANGIFLERSFSLNTKLAIYEDTAAAQSLSLSYGNACFQGNLLYHFKELALRGTIDANFEDFSFLTTDSPLEGHSNAHLVFSKDQIFLTLQGQQLKWKELFIPELKMEGAYKAKKLSFKISLPSFSVLSPAYEVFPHLQLDLDGLATLDKIAFEGRIWGLGEQPFSIQCELPILFSTSPLDIKIDQDARFSCRMQGKGSIDPILAFLENASLIARGKVDMDLSAMGTWREPKLTGYLVYTEGKIESLTTGALFRGIHLEMEGIRRELRIRHLTAHDLGRGDLSGFGQVVWDPENYFPFDFHLFANRFQILASDPFRASINGEATLSGNIREMSIDGKAILVDGHLAIPAKIPMEIPVIEVCYVNPIATPKPEMELNPYVIPIHWNITVEAPRHLIIDGRGLDSEWSGYLQITGEQNCLCYKGELNLVQGRFHIINRTFDLVEGHVRVEGLAPEQICIELKGDYELPSITASILVNGTLDATRVSFCSSPPMNTNQILSWIVFQQDIQELTPMQACSLASLLVSLSGKYSGPSTFEKFKEGLGIDVFSITDCDIDSSDLTFQVGKYLSQGTFVGINKSISGDYDSVLIQTRLYRNFFLEADYGGSLNGLTPNGGKVIFKWYKTY